MALGIPRYPCALALGLAACWGAMALGQTGETTGVTTRGVLGVGVNDPPPPWRGALVQTEIPNGPAARAGLQPRDLVVGVDSQPIHSAADLTGYVATRHAGDRLNLRVIRWNGHAFDQMEIGALLDPAPGAPAIAAAPPLSSGGAAGAAGNAVGPEGASVLAEITWTSFTDPYEQGFTVAVPRGWTVAGGVLRKSPLVPNAVLRLLAPDRATFIASGDPDNVDYNIPVPAAELARRFAENVLGQFCPGLQVTGIADRPEIAQFAMSKSIDPNLRWSAAEATVTCRRGGSQLLGQALAVFRYAPILRSGHPQILAGFVTRPGREQAATGVLDRVTNSFQENPAWTARKDQLVNQLHRSALARWGQEQRQFRAMDDVINNTAHYIGPGGRRYDLDATHRYQWIAPNGDTTGTDTPIAPPGGGWTLLQRVPE